MFISANHLDENRQASAEACSECDETLLEAFKSVVERFPSRIAVRSAQWEATYRELDDLSNRLANRIVAAGGAAGDPVAIVMEHDTPAYAAGLAALKAGRMVLVIDPGSPPAHRRTLMVDAEPSVVVTDPQNVALAREAATQCHVIEFTPEQPAGPATEVAIAGHSGDGAFLVYTSGSAGRPKGVLMTHRQLRRIVVDHTSSMRFVETDRIPHFAMMDTGQGVAVAWSALLNGALLCPHPVRKLGIAGLADWIVDNELTTFWSSASILRALMGTLGAQHVFTRIRAIKLSSERATSEDVALLRRHFLPATILVHTFSSSENSTIAWSCWTLNDVPEGVLPVGRVSPAIEVSIVGEDGEPVPDGEIGEILVKSRYVSAGYWRDPDLTAERFSDPIDDTGTRLVRLGDRGRINESGQLVLHGRADDRIKIRGNRVELSQIEQTLAGLDGVQNAAVVVIARDRLEPLLVAFVVPSGSAVWTEQNLRQQLGSRLPRHMVPPRVVLLEAFPSGPSGKIDREALRARASAIEPHSFQSARSVTETLLARFWEEAFDIDEVGRDADFFDLGGDSLIAAIIGALIQEERGLRIDIATFFDHPILADLAQAIDLGQVGVATEVDQPPISRSVADDLMPLTPYQVSSWQMSQSPEMSRVHTCLRYFEISGPLDRDEVQACLAELVERHEILRTSFVKIEDEPRQLVQSGVQLNLTFHDFGGRPAPEEAADSLFRQCAFEAFDLAMAPLVRFLLVKLAPDNHRLAYIHHHIISDGWSWNIFAREFCQLYKARLAGKSSADIGPVRQFRTYASWLDEAFAPGSSFYCRETTWWIAHLLAAAHPERKLYHRAQVFLVRWGWALPPKHKASLTKRLIRLFDIPRPTAASLPFTRSTLVRVVDPSEGYIRIDLTPELKGQLKNTCRQLGASQFVVQLAAYAALLGWTTGRPSASIISFFSSRTQPFAQNAFGPCINATNFILQSDPAQSFSSLVEVVRDHVKETQRHSEIPYQLVQKEIQRWNLPLTHHTCSVSLPTQHFEHRFGELRLTIPHEGFQLS